MFWANHDYIYIPNSCKFLFVAPLLSHSWWPYHPSQFGSATGVRQSVAAMRRGATLTTAIGRCAGHALFGPHMGIQWKIVGISLTFPNNLILLWYHCVWTWRCYSPLRQLFKGKKDVCVSGGYFSTNPHVPWSAAIPLQLSIYFMGYNSLTNQFNQLPGTSIHDTLQEWEATTEKNDSLLAHVVLQFYPKAATATGCIMNHVSLWQKMFVYFFGYLWFIPTTITHAGIDRTWSRPILNQAFFQILNWMT